MATSVAPYWLNDKYLDKVLKQIGVGHNIKIINSNITSAADSYDEQGSTVLRAIVQYSSSKTKNDKINLIIKLCGSKKNALSNSTITNEVKMYHIIVDMQRLFETVGDFVTFAPRLLFYTQEPHSVIVLEDLTTPPKSYSSVDKRLDLNETKKVFVKLAKWHAASIFVARDSKELNQFDGGIFNIQSEGLNVLLDDFKLFAEEVKTWPTFETYAEKLDNLSYKFMRRGKSVYTKSETEGYNVLNHGDFHLKNMLYKKDEVSHKILDSVLFDFQLSFWGTPAIDIYYLFYLVASDEVRINHENELIEFYYAEFVKALKTIGFMSRIPTMLELRVELLKNKFLEVVIAVCFLPSFFVDDSLKNGNVGTETNVEQRKKKYQNKEYQAIMKDLLPSLLTKGALD